MHESALETEGNSYAPSADERWSFVAEFEEAAERRFTSAERVVITAVSAWATAYEARLAHAFEPEQADRPGSFSEALTEPRSRTTLSVTTLR